MPNCREPPETKGIPSDSGKNQIDAMRELIWSIVENVAEEHIYLFPHHFSHSKVEVHEKFFTFI